jgi:hypothetical protein
MGLLFKVQGVDPATPAYRLCAALMLLLCIGFCVWWVVTMVLCVVAIVRAKRVATGKSRPSSRSNSLGQLLSRMASSTSRASVSVSAAGGAGGGAAAAAVSAVAGASGGNAAVTVTAPALIAPTASTTGGHTSAATPPRFEVRNPMFDSAAAASVGATLPGEVGAKDAADPAAYKPSTAQRSSASSLATMVRGGSRVRFDRGGQAGDPAP